MSTLHQRIQDIVRGLAGELNPGKDLSEIGPTSHLEWDLGIGSLERMELTQRLEKALETQLPPQLIFNARTVRDLIDVVENPTAPGGESRESTRILTPKTFPPFPEEAVSLLEALQYQAQHQGDRVLLYIEKEGQPERSVSAPELLAEAGKMAGALAEHGVRAGDRVGVMLPTGFLFVASFFALHWLGAVPVPLYPPFRADQAEDYVKRQSAIMENAGVKILVSFSRAWSMTQLMRLHAPTLKTVVTADSLVSDVTPPVHRGQSHELGLIQYTSGSTGNPKGVALTQANLLHNIRAYGHGLQVGAKDVCVSWLPLYHDMGLIGAMLGSLYHGIPLVLMAPQDFLARPSRWLWAVHRFGGTISPAPNFAYEICGRKIPDNEIAGLNLSTWRVALNGAEAVRIDTLNRFTDRYAPKGFTRETHFPCYGLAEAALAVAFSPLRREPKVDVVSAPGLERERVARPARDGEATLNIVACGFPLRGTEISLRNDAGQPVGEREEGRIFFRSGSALDSYYNNPEATNAIKSPDGWVDTGDQGYLADGEVYITGRRKDMILIAGRNLHPQDIEEIVTEVEGVRRGCVAAFGINDAERATEKLVVVFETREKGKAAQELAERVRRQVAQTISLPPDEVMAVQPGLLPKTPSGKIRRAECRQRYLAKTLSEKASLGKQVGRILRNARNLKGSLRGALSLKNLWGAWTTTSLFGVMGIPALGLSLVAPGTARKLIHPAAQLVLKLCGLRLKVEGSAYSGPCLVVSNHCSVLDPVVVIAAWPAELKFVVAPWVFENPLLKRGLRQLGHIKASRGDTAKAAELTEHMKAVLAAGGTFAGFPEGGLEVHPGLRPFSLGIFQVAAQARVPIVPMVVRGTRKALPWPNLVPKPTALNVRFGPPIPPSGESWAEIADLAHKARAWIAENGDEEILDQRLRRED